MADLEPKYKQLKGVDKRPELRDEIESSYRGPMQRANVSFTKPVEDKDQSRMQKGTGVPYEAYTEQGRPNAFSDGLKAYGE